MNLSNSKFRLLMHFAKLNWKVKGLKTIQIVKEEEILQIPELVSSSQS